MNTVIRGRWGLATTGPFWLLATRKDAPTRAPEWFLSTGRSGASINTYGPEYDVMARRELYLDFADLDPKDQDQLAAFANSHGLLGTAVEITPHDPVAYSQPHIYGEPLEEWVRLIREVHEAKHLRDAIEELNNAYLKKHLLRFKGSEDPTRPGPPGWRFSCQGFMATVFDDQELRWNPDGGDLANRWVAARALLCRFINARLAEYAVPSIWYSAKTKKPEIRLMPRNLIGVIWLQLAFAVSGSPDYRNCDECGRMFEQTKVDMANNRKRRADRRYCSDACKSRAYRKRQNQSAARGKKRRPTT